MSRTRMWLCLSALALGVGLGACADQLGDGVDSRGLEPKNGECVRENVVDKELLAFLSKAKAVHLRADIAEDEGDAAGAVAALDELLTGPMPRSTGPEMREVLADTLARSAELKSTLGQFDLARADVQRGLELATERTHYRGRLLEVLGVVEKRLHEKLLDDGDEAGAAEAKKRAIDALQDAINIQDEVIRRALGEPAPGP